MNRSVFHYNCPILRSLLEATEKKATRPSVLERTPLEVSRAGCPLC